MNRSFQTQPLPSFFQGRDEPVACKLMNNPSTNTTGSTAKSDPRLLDAIRAIRTSVGDGLNDNELTCLLRQTALPGEAGFVFLNFSGGFVMLAVPRQDPVAWYPEKGWIVAGKEKVARAVAEKHGLSLSEPPDEISNFKCSLSDTPRIRHHLELTNRWDTVIMAHPNYLKVRLFGATSSARFVSNSKEPLPWDADLLQDLSVLYQS